MQREPVNDQEAVRRFDAAVDRAVTKANFRDKNKEELKMRIRQGGKENKDNSR